MFVVAYVFVRGRVLLSVRVDVHALVDVFVFVLRYAIVFVDVFVFVLRYALAGALS
jgi:hypothetical protein